jgi:predicted esterase
VCVFVSEATQLIVDVGGYFPDGSSFVGLAPGRLADSRPGGATVDGVLAGGDTRAAGSVTVVPVAGRAGVHGNAASVALNVTVTQAAGAGYASVYPCGSEPPNASNLNFDAGQTIANAAVVKVGADAAVCVFVSEATQLIVDVGGYFPSGPPPPPASSVPPNPIAFTEAEVFTLDSPLTDYWIHVPEQYDESHQTPTTLFVWLHGCGGQSSGDIYTVSPGGDQNWISITVGGREGACWDPAGDGPKVKAAIADVKEHFNVDPREVVLGGYSSGGDLAYRTAFYDAGSFAGVLAEDTAPFRDTGSSPADSLAAASWKFNVVHLAHLQDDTYPIATVRAETDVMKAAGFPVTLIERVGDHYNNPGDVVNGQAVPGTDADLVAVLLPYLQAGWRAP